MLQSAVAQRDEARAALAAAQSKISEFEVREAGAKTQPVTTILQSHIQKLTRQLQHERTQQQEQCQPHHSAASPLIDESEISAIEEVRHLRDALLQTQNQQRLQQCQHELQRSLLQNSCNELQAEVEALRAALITSNSDADILRARVLEAEVSIPQLSLTAQHATVLILHDRPCAMIFGWIRFGAAEFIWHI